MGKGAKLLDTCDWPDCPNVGDDFDTFVITTSEVYADVTLCPEHSRFVETLVDQLDRKQKRSKPGRKAGYAAGVEATPVRPRR